MPAIVNDALNRIRHLVRYETEGVNHTVEDVEYLFRALPVNHRQAPGVTALTGVQKVSRPSSLSWLR